MYKRLKAHASIYLSAEELGVSDYEDEDGEVYPGGEGMLMGDMGPQVYGLDEDEDEEDAPRRMMCRICPEKLLNSEQDVEKHLNSLVMLPRRFILNDNYKMVFATLFFSSNRRAISSL